MGKIELVVLSLSACKLCKEIINLIIIFIELFVNTFCADGGTNGRNRTCGVIIERWKIVQGNSRLTYLLFSYF